MIFNYYEKKSTTASVSNSLVCVVLLPPTPALIWGKTATLPKINQAPSRSSFSQSESTQGHRNTKSQPK